MITDETHKRLEENLEYARLAILNGNVYQVKWPALYLNDVGLLMKKIEELYSELQERNNK